MLSIQRNLHRHGIDAAIEKPVFDILTPLGPARPDFLIEARSRITGEIKRLAIDAIDHGDDEHDGSSTSGHSRLCEIAPLLCLSSGDLVLGRVARKIAAALDL